MVEVQDDDAYGPAKSVLQKIEQRPILAALITFPTLFVISAPLAYITGVFSIIVLENTFADYGPMVPIILTVAVLFALLGTYTAYVSSRRVAAKSA